LARSIKFNEMLDKFIIPVRLAIMALLSSSKVSVFEDSIIEFMEKLLAYKVSKFVDGYEQKYY
jgi:hypothetical protein